MAVERPHYLGHLDADGGDYRGTGEGLGPGNEPLCPEASEEGRPTLSAKVTAYSYKKS